MHPRLDGLRVVTLVVQCQVQRLAAGPGLPQPDDVDGLGAVAGDQHVAGFAEYCLPRHPAGPQPALIVGHRLGMAVEPDDLPVIGGGELPRVAVEGPVVGVLDLITILEGLLEDPVLVADAVAHGRHVEGGQRVQQAGGQPAEPAVAQPGLNVEGLDVSGGDAGAGHGLAGEVGGAGIDGVLGELASQHVLRRQVVDELGVGLVVRLGCPGPAVSQPVTYCDGQRPVGVLGARRPRRRPPLVTQVVSEALFELGQRLAHPPCPQSASYGHAPNLTLSARRRQSRPGTGWEREHEFLSGLSVASVSARRAFPQDGVRASGLSVLPRGLNHLLLCVLSSFGCNAAGSLVQVPASTRDAARRSTRSDQPAEVSSICRPVIRAGAMGQPRPGCLPGQRKRRLGTRQ